MVIPGDSAAEFVVLGGFVNFLGLYNSIITVRILLSWFPQAQGQPVLQPLFVVTDPFLNLREAASLERVFLGARRGDGALFELERHRS